MTFKAALVAKGVCSFLVGLSVSLAGIVAAPGTSTAAEAWPANVRAVYDINFNGFNVGSFEFQSQAEQQSRANPSRTCRALRAQMGAQPFTTLYGKSATARNSYGKCVSAWARAQTKNELNAAAACSAEQSDATFAATHSAKTFAQFYGTDSSHANAFGQCVSSKAKAAAQTQQQATVSAAKACAGELNANRAAFKAKYGTFGRCVSQHT